MTAPRLFTPLSLRRATLRNRVIISPTCQYSAQDGVANELKVRGIDVIDCSSGDRSDHGIPPAEMILRNDQADLVAIAREAHYDPDWPLRAEQAMTGDSADFGQWPVLAGWWLE